jgi:hypothetical protein
LENAIRHNRPVLNLGFVMLSRFVLAAVLAVSAGVTGLLAQSVADIGVPAELPPSSFTGQQYVDSRGCVFLRAAIGGRVTWAPRLDGNRSVLCGYAPTFDSPPVAVAQAEPEAAAEPKSPAPATPVVAAAAPVAPVAAAPRPARVTPSPAPVVVTQAPQTAVAPRTGSTPRKIGCFTNTPVPVRVQLANGDSAVLCTRGDGTLDGARVPIYPPGSGGGASLTESQIATAQIMTQPSRMATPTEAPVRTAAVVTGTFYVQVGTFGVPDNVAGARDRLRALGLTTARSSVTHGGRQLTIVFAGPFGTHGDAQLALRAARGAGFGDAFIR